MDTPLTTNAYSELRKAGFFSGSDPVDDKIVTLVTDFCKGVDYSGLAPDQVKVAILLLDTLAFGGSIKVVGPVN